MKKAYFITYVGALLSCILTVAGINKVTKKYGQPLRGKRLSIPTLIDGADKALTALANRK